jgi:predicted amidohydrolase YtcJ/crotonobetainyl-CoA:carnitine CoA-transferase CaiB-like acyl-CoA transferase
LRRHLAAAGLGAGAGETTAVATDRDHECPVLAWATSGAMALTGWPGAPAWPDGDVIGAVNGAARVLREMADKLGGPGRVVLDPRLLCVRAATRSATTRGARRGTISYGGQCRLLATGGDWVAVNLCRPEDVALLPALSDGRIHPEAAVGGAPGERLWAQLADEVGRRPANEVVAAAQELGLPASVLATAPSDEAAPWWITPMGAAGPPVDGRRWPLVVDFTAMWAGPLCAHLLARSGARVVTVESVDRPDGARIGDARLHAELHRGHDRLLVDFASVEDRRRIRGLMASADVVLEASRPRALGALGLEVAGFLSARPGRTWVSITGYGREGPQSGWVAFGDDAAVAGGLVGRDQQDAPVFCADAIADPVTGVLAAVAALASLTVGGGHLIDCSMAAASAFVNQGGRCRGSHRVERRGDGWVAFCDETGAPVTEPWGTRQPLSPSRFVAGGSRAPMSSTPPAALVFRDVEVDGRAGCRVGVAGGIVTFVEDRSAAPGRLSAPGDRDATVVDGGGGALLPGLHDHHLHLLAMAARAGSVPCGPPEVADRDELAGRLRAAALATPPGQWVRGYGYDDTATGPLDALLLDELMGEQRKVPVRVQHRSGHQWLLNQAGVELIEATPGLPANGHGVGVYLDLDLELGRRWPTQERPSVGTVARQLATFGVTGVTDATVTNGAAEVAIFEEALASGNLPQRLHLLGGDLPARGGDRLSMGARKIVLADHALPPLDDLVAEIAAAGGRGVAIHCVTRASLVLAAVALREGPLVTARLEHAAVAPPEVVSLLDGLKITVVTQPGFIRTNGDRYHREVEQRDLPWLYRLRGWTERGIHLAGSSDAPFGDADPWSAMRAATERRTGSGAAIGLGEALTPEEALALYLTPLDDPGGRRRRVAPGAPADLCLLSDPWTVARGRLDASLVRATYVGGVPMAAG